MANYNQGQVTAGVPGRAFVDAPDTSTRRLYDFSDRVADLSPDESPFFVYLSKVGKVPTSDSQFRFLEDRTKVAITDRSFLLKGGITLVAEGSDDTMIFDTSGGDGVDWLIPGMVVAIGDVDGNSALDIFDIMLLVDIILGDPSVYVCAEEAGDITQDGHLNVLDVIGLIQIILGGNQQQAMTYLESILDPIMFKQLTQELIMIESPKIFVWPNPSNSVMNINGYGYVQIYDMLGKEVYENYLSGHHIWDTRDLPSGIYHVINKGETVTVTLLK